MKISILEAIKLFLFPILIFISIIFLFLVCFAPASSIPHALSLVIISPGLYVPLKNSSSSTGDGPTIRLGYLHSCSQANNSANTKCQTTLLFPKYDFSDLTSSFSNSPEISAVPTLGFWLVVGLTIWGFFSSYYCIRVWGRSPVGSRFKWKMGGYKIMLWFTIFASLGYLFLMIAIFTGYSRLKKQVDTFNKDITALEPTGPQVQAALSDGLAFGGAAVMLSLPVVVIMVFDASKLYGWSTKSVIDEERGERGEKGEDYK